MDLNKNVIKPGQIWRHYKGKDYRIISLSRSTDDLTWYVVYEALCENELSQIWHRRFDEFLGSLKYEGKRVVRFSKKETNEENNVDDLIHNSLT